MASGWNVMDALNSRTKSAAVDNKPKARFRTKDINIAQMYSNDKNFYSLPDIEQLAQDIYAVGLLENLTVVHDPCERGEYRIIAGERRWRALTYLVEQGHEEFSVASCQIKTPAEEHEEMIQLILANTSRTKTTKDILEEQKTLEKTLKYMKENGLTLHGYKLDSGRLRDVIADMMHMSATKIAQVESINRKLIDEFSEDLKEDRIKFSAAYEISKLPEKEQRELLEQSKEEPITLKDVEEYKKKAEEEKEQIPNQMSMEELKEQKKTIEKEKEKKNGIVSESDTGEKTEKHEEKERDETPDTTTVPEKAEKEEPEEEKEHSETEIEQEQPGILNLKNNEQRKEWLKNYKAWGLWYRDEHIDVNYYKYDFADGSRLIVAEYPNRRQYWNPERTMNEYHMHLIEKNKKYGGSDKMYEGQYMNDTDSMTSVVEFLKKNATRRKIKNENQEGKTKSLV